jgi:plasmid stabilization system protein ParE
VKRYEVVFAPDAAADIEEAYRWYRAENPAAAETWRAGIEAAMLGLSTMPERSSVAPESSALDIEVRQLHFWSKPKLARPVCRRGRNGHGPACPPLAT